MRAGGVAVQAIRQGSPRGQSGRGSQLVFLTTVAIAFLFEVAVKVGVDADELLQRLHLSKLEHRALASSEGKVAVLDPVVSPATDLPMFWEQELVKVVSCPD
jgi:hypothetical protein